MKANALKETKEWIISIIIAAILAFTIKFFLFDVIPISGPSMEPTLISSDRVAIEKVTRYTHNIKRGQLVIFNPDNGSKYPYVKRIIGLASDKVEIRDGLVYINDIKLEEPYLKADTYTNNDMVVTVPGEHIFVLGDHREISEDSRIIGPVPIKNLVGHVLFRIYPFNKIRGF